MTPEIFIDWIIKNKVIELLIGDSLHIELIKRCHDIIKFMCKYQKFPLEMLEILWDAIKDKHETIVQAIYDLLVEISENLSKEGLDIIYRKIRSMDFNQYNEMTILLLKRFSENANSICHKQR